MPVFLIYGELDPGQAIKFRSVLRACRAYKKAVDKYGAARVQSATVHLARDENTIEETPDFTLQPGAFGGVRVTDERARRG